MHARVPREWWQSLGRSWTSWEELEWSRWEGKWTRCSSARPATRPPTRPSTSSRTTRARSCWSRAAAGRLPAATRSRSPLQAKQRHSSFIFLPLQSTIFTYIFDYIISVRLQCMMTQFSCLEIWNKPMIVLLLTVTTKTQTLVHVFSILETNDLASFKSSNVNWIHA